MLHSLIIALHKKQFKKSDSTLFEHWQTRKSSGWLSVQGIVKKAYTLTGLIGQLSFVYRFDVSKWLVWIL